MITALSIARGSSRRSHDNHHAILSPLFVVPVDLRPRVLIEPIVLNVTDNTDHLCPRQALADSNPLADWILIGPELVGDLFVDNGDDSLRRRRTRKVLAGRHDP